MADSAVSTIVSFTALIMRVMTEDSLTWFYLLSIDIFDHLPLRLDPSHLLGCWLRFLFHTDAFLRLATDLLSTSGVGSTDPVSSTTEIVHP